MNMNNRSEDRSRAQEFFECFMDNDELDQLIIQIATKIENPELYVEFQSAINEKGLQWIDYAYAAKMLSKEEIAWVKEKIEEKIKEDDGDDQGNAQ